ncbi:alpha/beta fold hydrolase [Oceaniglobus trochenteri]|uniref:alpha/beta fold hydrolase n=1 Tax=Oceaniglobus trochenteri TaxID=2763260 RepID=UPI001D0010F0|nr:alpha/beta fold hydrolase [Oceaniglobus trochenteri]
MLNVITHGSPTDRPPLLIAHGLFGSARNWGVIAKRLSDSRQVQAVDMRNHGESFRDPSHSYPALADDLAGVLDGPGDVLGHSMGGKAAMVLALRRPDLVRRLVVADIAPVGYGHTQMPLIDAMRGLDLSQITSRGQADAALADAIPEQGVRAFLLQSLDVAGRTWRLNLDVLASEMSGIIGWPEITGRYEGETLFLTGADSDYVQREHRERIRSYFPAARFAKIPGAGHWLHAEKPREFEAAVRAFLDRPEGG